MMKIKAILLSFAVIFVGACSTTPDTHVWDGEEKGLKNFYVLTSDSGIDEKGGPRVRNIAYLFKTSKGWKLVPTSHASEGMMQSIMKEIPKTLGILGGQLIVADAMKKTAKTEAEAIINSSPKSVTYWRVNGGAATADAFSDQAQSFSADFDIVE